MIFVPKIAVGKLIFSTLPKIKFMVVYVFAQTQRWKPEALQILQSSIKIQLMQISQNIKCHQRVQTGDVSSSSLILSIIYIVKRNKKKEWDAVVGSSIIHHVNGLEPKQILKVNFLIALECCLKTYNVKELFQHTSSSFSTPINRTT